MPLITLAAVDDGEVGALVGQDGHPFHVGFGNVIEMDRLIRQSAGVLQIEQPL